MFYSERVANYKKNGRPSHSEPLVGFSFGVQKVNPDHGGGGGAHFVPIHLGTKTALISAVYLGDDNGLPSGLPLSLPEWSAILCCRKLTRD